MINDKRLHLKHIYETPFPFKLSLKLLFYTFTSS